MDDKLSKVFRYLDNEKGSLVRLTKRMIETPTVNPPGLNNARMATLLVKECRKSGLKVRKIHVPKAYLKRLGKEKTNPMVNVLAEWKTGPYPTFHINYHYDVVPATNNWKTNPFKAVAMDDKLYGRGSEDCKGSIAAVIYAIKGLKKLGLIPRVNLQISFTPDEETGGKAGLGYLVKHGYIKADFALGEGYSRDYVSCGNKGVLWAEVVVKGKSCHASQPERGINSFENMLKVGEALKRLKKDIEKRHTRYPTKEKSEKSATMVLGGLLSGGKAVNVVPDRSVFTIDRRIIPEEKIDEVRKELQNTLYRVVKNNHGLDVSLRIMTAEEPVVVSPKEEICKVFQKVIYKVSRRHAKLALMGGVTDMRYLIRKGIPAVGYGVAGKEHAHADNEFIYITSLVETSKILATLIMSLNEEGEKNNACKTT